MDFDSSSQSADWIRCNEQVQTEPDNFMAWESLIRVTESLEGGLNRNSSVQAVDTMRDVYNRMLEKFPLLFGYWKKYADIEFTIAGTERAEMVQQFYQVFAEPDLRGL